MIKQTCYRSLSNSGPDMRVLAMFRDILAVSERNNSARGITGYLLFDRHVFAQVLEGEAGAVDAAFSRIRADRRHSEVTLLGSRERRDRQFAKWSMGGATIGALGDREILLRHGLEAEGWQRKLDAPGLIAVALDFAARHLPRR
ncbi:BLUF domain-containing protein [Bosea sp. (in: a-proteobacteria)]|uniref:BLUF domain-containing protein n=1 Tax=Bosea sp. (in: a-proteobacteria) TaxID=1871050 RepID=UPI003B3B0D02